MSIYKFDVKAFLNQIQFDEDNQRLVWKPKELQDNIFLLLGIARKVFNVRIKGSPYKIDDETWAINVEEKVK